MTLHPGAESCTSNQAFSLSGLIAPPGFWVPVEHYALRSGGTRSPLNRALSVQMLVRLRCLARLGVPKRQVATF
jgi:hypothetical protein